MHEKSPDEATIVAYLHREDADAGIALGWIMDKYNRRLYTTIRRWVRNHEDASDLLQEVLLKIWKNRLQFQGNSALFSWMYRIAFNESMQFLRKEQRHFTVDLDIPIVEFHHQSQHFGKISADEITEWLMDAVQQLPEKQRQVFEHKYFDDLKYEEISQLTGISVGGLKANYFHAVQKIEEFLKTRLNHS